ncbi:hypothetical protein [Lederbergia galactosidilytica]|uniref:Uncharacterized protein n=1 Tax=Lederbergia galactosidilytica TaxID=217031 RepID=A0A0Q9Y2X7_9BACI|nr:hypothetical protein [Lederbergia galactosidilytica]KRG11118.1 hypothetical protein ACA29_19155 [Lederbergia galactosidilytica]KRG14325.1 hypothetical protein ACA30_12215 [Virgibacillus soli]MBP1914395.1 hypothetical protein [Lederbergia galactosidilytica]OAK75737.1 hypothetical protein ABB05_00865 [Lederbergia galactosidilytica]
MTERIPCRAVGYNATILHRAAAETGSICMHREIMIRSLHSFRLSMEQIYVSLSYEEAVRTLKYAMELHAVNNECEADDLLLSLM